MWETWIADLNIYGISNTIVICTFGSMQGAPHEPNLK